MKQYFKRCPRPPAHKWKLQPSKSWNLRCDGRCQTTWCLTRQDKLQKPCLQHLKTIQHKFSAPQKQKKNIILTARDVLVTVASSRSTRNGKCFALLTGPEVWSENFAFTIPWNPDWSPLRWAELRIQMERSTYFYGWRRQNSGLKLIKDTTAAKSKSATIEGITAIESRLNCLPHYLP